MMIVLGRPSGRLILLKKPNGFFENLKKPKKKEKGRKKKEKRKKKIEKYYFLLDICRNSWYAFVYHDAYTCTFVFLSKRNAPFHFRRKERSLLFALFANLQNPHHNGAQHQIDRQLHK